MSGDEVDQEEAGSHFNGVSKVRDFETEAGPVSPERVSSPESRYRFRKQKKKMVKRKVKKTEPEQPAAAIEQAEKVTGDRTISFFDHYPNSNDPPGTAHSTTSRSKSHVWRPGLPKLLSQNVFVNPPPQYQDNANRPRLRRASSLPDLARAHTIIGRGFRPSHVGDPVHKSLSREAGEDPDEEEDAFQELPELSRTAAVVMLLVSTGLVALCAEFLVSAIPGMTAQSSVSQAFIGLIILPIVGNAAEHVTAVTVAMKNKMDLAIGVAVGSSIQIALFVTPLVVILGWIIKREMTLYFTIFETISLFVTAFVVNFLVLDGKSNYLEGTLLIASYIIIAVAAFFYPDTAAQSELGGSEIANNGTRMAVRATEALVSLAFNG